MAKPQNLTMTSSENSFIKLQVLSIPTPRGAIKINFFFRIVAARIKQN